MAKADPGGAPLSREDALAMLDAVNTAMHQQYPDHPDRLAQLDAALATAGMAVEHIHDEAVRHGHDPVAHAKATGTYVRED